MRARFLLFGILLIVAHLSNGQQFVLRHYTAVDGLPQSQVNAIVEDANGYLWIGTNGGGLARFDGKEFKTYNTLDGLLSNIVTSLMLDSKQNLWIVHPHGISRFNGVQFTVFQSPEPHQKRLRRVFEQHDSIFFTTQAGAIGKIFQDSVYYWEKSILPGKNIFSAGKLRDQNLAFYLNDSSFLLMDAAGNRKVISHKDKFSRVLSLFYYRSKFVIKSEHGYYSLNTTNGSFEEEPFNFKKHVVAYDSLNKFFWDFTKGNLSFEKEIDGQSESVLKDVMVSQIHFDKEGNTWIGTNGKGLYKYATQDFDRCASDNLNSVMAINKDSEGATWVGSSEKGLWKISKGKSKHYDFEYNAHGINDIKISPTNQLWIASGNGLGKYDAIKDQFKFYNREDGLSSQYILNIDFDEKGGLWCGTTGAGVNYFDGTKFTSFTQDDGLKGLIVYAIRYFKNDKTLFIGTEFGLSTLQNNTLRKLEVPELIHTSVFSINVYQDSLLLVGSSGSGVLIFDPATQTVKKLLATKDGLPSNLIYFAAADQDGYIWIGTEQGINRIRLNSSLELTENLHYGFENGLNGVETNQNAFYFGDEKFFGLIDGIYQFNNNQNLPEKSQDLHLTSVELFYGEFSARNFSDSTTGFFKVPYQPIFPSSKNHISFLFNRVSKRNPQSVRYKYYLQNFDMAWSQPTSLGQVTYGNLPPGKYTLNVLSTNKKGSWDSVPLQYSFTIEAPFYATITFVVFITIILIGLLFLILSLRIRSRTKRVLEIEHIRQQEQAHLRKEIARDFHDEMGNQLTRIINYISVMKLSKNGQAVELYNKVEDSAKYLYTGTRDFIWSIDPQNDELSRLFLHIRDFGEKLFEEKEINFRAYNSVKDPMRAPYGFSREANLIMKEAMTNVFNHSQAKNVAFILKQNNDQFEMILEDDGIGFSMSVITHVNGIKNMRIRAERIKSILRIQNIENKTGTIVSLSFTITKTKKYANRI
jgi:signal transduction histidine kinase/sugar lactone lactonase YvrE